MANTKTTMPRAGQKIVAGLKDVLAALKSGRMQQVEDRFQTRRVAKARLAMPSVSAADVLLIRESLGLTVPMCAAVLGVSVKTVRDLERGAKPIPAIAVRLLDEMRRNPDYWKLRVRELTA